MLADEFEVIERSDKSEILLDEDRFGYQSVHYLVRIGARRCSFAEYARFDGASAEIQVRTILQHAWAEIEHDIQYKSSAAIPTAIHRRFTSLAGLLEMADREFQAIQDEDRRLRTSARNLVSEGQLGGVEITPDSLKTYLDRKLGPDGRISEWQYDWTAKLLKRLGFKTLEEAEECVRGYDDDRLSRILWGTRHGQIARFEYMLMAAMGEHYVQRHTFAGYEWFGKREREMLGKLAEANVPIGTYDPLTAPRADGGGGTSSAGAGRG
jgi:hypothetical protein